VENIVAAVAVDTVDVDIVVVVLLSAAYQYFFAVDAAVNMDAVVVAAVAHHHIFVPLAAWAAHYYFVATELVVAVAAAVHTLDEEAAAVVDAKEDNSFDFDLHDSVAAGAAYDVSFVGHLHHHLPTANLHHLYSQHIHLDTVAISYSFSVLLIHHHHHLAVSCCNDVHCINVDDY